MGDNVNAMRDYQSAILMQPRYGLAYYNSANVLLLHKQVKQARESLDKAIDFCGMRDESSYQNRAIAKVLENDLSGALRDLCEALKYDKYSAHVYMNRGILLYKMENYTLADKDFTNALSLTPNDALVYKLRADCRGKLEQREASVEDYKMAMSLQQTQEMRKFYRIKPTIDG
jgi:tetratricopeptide (TPR) repeat protein